MTERACRYCGGDEYVVELVDRYGDDVIAPCPQCQDWADDYIAHGPSFAWSAWVARMEEKGVL